MELKKLFFDIETEPNEEALPFLPVPSAPSNYKDPEKIKAYVDEKTKEQVDKMALSIDLGKITAIGMKMGVDGQIVGRLVTEKYTETDLLKSFWRCMRICNGDCVGYNILGFDLPFIMRRSWALGVPVTVFPDMRRYSNFPTTDLMQILAGWDRDKIKSLKFICARYGIDNPLPELEGSQYAGMDDETKLSYVKNDVYLTFQLYQKMTGYYI